MSWKYDGVHVSGEYALFKYHDETEVAPSEVDPDNLSLPSLGSGSSANSDFSLTSSDYMALIETIDSVLALPLLPEGWTSKNDFKAIGQLSAPTPRNLEPVGPQFLAHARRV